MDSTCKGTIGIIRPTTRKASKSLFPRRTCNYNSTRNCGRFQLSSPSFVRSSKRTHFGFFQHKNTIVNPLIKRNQTRFSSIKGMGRISKRPRDPWCLIRFFPNATRRKLLLRFFVVSKDFSSRRRFHVKVTHNGSRNIPRKIRFPHQFPILHRVTRMLRLIFRDPFQRNSKKNQFPTLQGRFQ